MSEMEMEQTRWNEAVFRPMEKGDIASVAVIERACFLSPWTENMLRSELKNKYAHYHVLELDGELIGYVGMWVLYDESHITNIAVMPAYRRAGYARNMMLAAMRIAASFEAKKMTLEVRESNLGAQALYAQLDFERVGLRKRYYSDTGENAFILWNTDIARTLHTAL